MKIQINTNKMNGRELRSMANLLLELAGDPIAERLIGYPAPDLSPVKEPDVPADLDIASGLPTVPKVVTVWTSKGNEELVKEHLNVADTVERVDIRLANEEDDTAKRKRKTRSDKGKTRKPVDPYVINLHAIDPDDPNPVKMITTDDGVVVGHYDKSTGEVSGDIVFDPSLAANIATVGNSNTESDLQAIREKLAAIKGRKASRERAEADMVVANRDLAVRKQTTTPENVSVRLAEATLEALKDAAAKVIVEETSDQPAEADMVVANRDLAVRKQTTTPENVSVRLAEATLEALKDAAAKVIVEETSGQPAEVAKVADRLKSRQATKQDVIDSTPDDVAEALEAVDKAIDEAVVEVKTDTVEMDGSIDEALTAIDAAKPKGALITEEQVARLREIRVEAAKLDVFPEFRKVIVESCGHAGKFPDIPREVADRIIPEIETIITNAQEGAKVADEEKAKVADEEKAKVADEEKAKVAHVSD